MPIRELVKALTLLRSAVTIGLCNALIPDKERGPDRSPSPSPRSGPIILIAIPLDVRKSSMDDRVALLEFICRQNIGRYEKMLRTELTDLERAFIERRLSEEKQALQFVQAQTPPRAVRNELKNTYLAAKGTVTALFLNPFELLVSNFNLVGQIALI